jgi:hypothetical protein
MRARQHKGRRYWAVGNKIECDRRAHVPYSSDYHCATDMTWFFLYRSPFCWRRCCCWLVSILESSDPLRSVVRSFVQGRIGSKSGGNQARFSWLQLFRFVCSFFLSDNLSSRTGRGNMLYFTSWSWSWPARWTNERAYCSVVVTGTEMEGVRKASGRLLFLQWLLVSTGGGWVNLDLSPWNERIERESWEEANWTSLDAASERKQRARRHFFNNLDTLCLLFNSTWMNGRQI